MSAGVNDELDSFQSLNVERSSPQNSLRARRASAALDAWRQEDCTAGEVTELTDLLTDLMHLCDEKGLNFDNINSMARDHWKAENSELD